MASTNRARRLALAGVTSMALMVPITPAAQAAPAAAAPAQQSVAATTAAGATGVDTGWRKRKRKRVVRTARSLRGIPYRWGGSTPRGFDCSGFTQYVMRVNGVRVPRVAAAQRSATRWIPRSRARKGDLVFFHGRNGVYHVGIYGGKNRVWHSPRSGRTVGREWIWTRSVSFGRAF